MDDRPTWERELDALVRPVLLVDPPADVQRAILAAVLQATAQAPRPTVLATSPIAASFAERSITMAAYVMLAAVFVAYVAALSWLQGLLGGGGWLPTLLTQLLAVSDLVVGRPLGEPNAVVRLVSQYAPWLALLPLAWLLWERDRAATDAA
jgi:hypothetical protein